MSQIAKWPILYSILRIVVGISAAVFVVLVAGAGCKKQDPDAWLLKDPAYKGWLVEADRNVRIYYPPSHPHAAEMKDMAAKYNMVIRSISQSLGLPEPTDTLKVVYYTGMGQGKEMTGTNFPFGDSLGVARFWLPFAPGIPVAQIYIRKWVPTPPKFAFLWHGLVTLFDFQGEDYHATTLGFVKDNYFIPLSQLAADTTINSDNERYQSAEAASFCAYVLGNYGVNWLKSLYMSELPFDESIRQVLGMSVDSAQAEWLTYARQASPKYRNQSQSDSNSQK